ncbi:HalOD1 output domain-containing protein [Haladaptatus pallidirubidus]|uniref:HalOD1 output domain-containing protein n=1 Tax=Haladaptatus pallidirubidus TaxID=1008152 RepID=UPI001D0F781B|nr:HalOD1 output domain-containing protein [Haladaptatus pallidirubidus]
MNGPSDSQSSPLIRTSPAQSISIATAIVSAIERVDGDRPDTPLYEVIEPDALEALYEHGRQRVEFQYADYQVTVQPDQTILVSEPTT